MPCVMLFTRNGCGLSNMFFFIGLDLNYIDSPLLNGMKPILDLLLLTVEHCWIL
jgi:hypothetical protein